MAFDLVSGVMETDASYLLTRFPTSVQCIFCCVRGQSEHKSALSARGHSSRVLCFWTVYTSNSTSQKTTNVGGQTGRAIILWKRHLYSGRGALHLGRCIGSNSCQGADVAQRVRSVCENGRESKTLAPPRGNGWQSTRGLSHRRPKRDERVRRHQKTQSRGTCSSALHAEARMSRSRAVKKDN